MTISKQFLSITLLCAGLSQAAAGNWQNWLSEQVKTNSALFQEKIWQPVCQRIPFAQPTADFLAEHKKASLLAGTVLGFVAYKWYDNKMSTWSLRQADGRTMPTCLGGRPNDAAPSNPRYDARLHIINTITANAEILSDMLRSLHNQGTTRSLLPWAGNTIAQTQPSVVIKAMSGNIECFNIKTSLDTNQEKSVVITLTNSRSNRHFTGRGKTLSDALQDLSTHIIEQVQFHNDKTLQHTINMTEGWNLLCGDVLNAYKIQEETAHEPQPLQFVCETKVRRYTQPANKSIAEANKVFNNLKDAHYFVEKLVSCFAQANELIQPPQEIIAQPTFPAINQATGIVPDEDEDSSFYDFRYHIEQFVQQNLRSIISCLNILNAPTKNLLTVTFRGTIAETQNSFDLSITYFKANGRITLSLKNNHTNETLRFGTDEQALNLYTCLNKMVANLNNTANFNTWCGDSLLGLQIQDDNPDHVTHVPTFECTTQFNDHVDNPETLDNLEQAVFNGFEQNL